MRGDDAAPLGHQMGEGHNDIVQIAQPAVGGDDADEITHRLGEALLLQHGERGPGGLVYVDQRRFDQAAEVGAGVDQATERLHLRHHGVQRVLLIGVRIECRGVAVGQSAAGCNRRSAIGHVPFPVLGRARARAWMGDRPPTGARPLAWGPGGRNTPGVRQQRACRSRASRRAASGCSTASSASTAAAARSGAAPSAMRPSRTMQS